MRYEPSFDVFNLTILVTTPTAPKNKAIKNKISKNTWSNMIKEVGIIGMVYKKVWKLFILYQLRSESDTFQFGSLNGRKQVAFMS